MKTRSKASLVDTSQPKDSSSSDQHHKAYESSSNDLPSFHGNPKNDVDDMKLELETVQHFAPSHPEDSTHAYRSPTIPGDDHSPAAINNPDDSFHHDSHPHRGNLKPCTAGDIPSSPVHLPEEPKGSQAMFNNYGQRSTIADPFSLQIDLQEDWQDTEPVISHYAYDSDTSIESPYSLLCDRDDIKPQTESVEIGKNSMSSGKQPNPKIYRHPTEPIYPGDVIMYRNPAFRFHDSRALHTSTVISIDPDRDPILLLDNNLNLDKNTMVQRIRTLSTSIVDVSGKSRLRRDLPLHDHAGKFRRIHHFKLKKRQPQVILPLKPIAKHGTATAYTSVVNQSLLSNNDQQPPIIDMFKSEKLEPAAVTHPLPKYSEESAPTIPSPTILGEDESLTSVEDSYNRSYSSSADECEKEPLRKGDVIVYSVPCIKGPLESKVLWVDPSNQWPLTLEYIYALDMDYEVRRIQTPRRTECVDAAGRPKLKLVQPLEMVNHRGRFRSLKNYRLRPSRGLQPSKLPSVRKSDAINLTSFPAVHHDDNEDDEAHDLEHAEWVAKETDRRRKELLSNRPSQSKSFSAKSPATFKVAQGKKGDDSLSKKITKDSAKGDLNFEGMNKEQLKSLLRHKGLAVSGNKDQLILRISSNARKSQLHDTDNHQTIRQHDATQSPSPIVSFGNPLTPHSGRRKKTKIIDDLSDTSSLPSQPRMNILPFRPQFATKESTLPSTDKVQGPVLNSSLEASLKESSPSLDESCFLSSSLKESSSSIPSSDKVNGPLFSSSLEEIVAAKESTLLSCDTLHGIQESSSSIQSSNKAHGPLWSSSLVAIVHTKDSTLPSSDEVPGIQESSSSIPLSDKVVEGPLLSSSLEATAAAKESYSSLDESSIHHSSSLKESSSSIPLSDKVQGPVLNSSLEAIVATKESTPPSSDKVHGIQKSSSSIPLSDKVQGPVLSSSLEAIVATKESTPPSSDKVHGIQKSYSSIPSSDKVQGTVLNSSLEAIVAAKESTLPSGDKVRGIQELQCSSSSSIPITFAESGLGDSNGIKRSSFIDINHVFSAQDESYFSLLMKHKKDRDISPWPTASSLPKNYRTFYDVTWSIQQVIKLLLPKQNISGDIFVLVKKILDRRTGLNENPVIIIDSVFSSLLFPDIDVAPSPNQKTLENYITQHAAFFTAAKVFIPLNKSNSHWAQVVMDNENKKMYHLDSCHWRGYHYMKGILDYLKAIVSKGEHFKEVDLSYFDDWLFYDIIDVPLQDGNGDCGVFALLFLDRCFHGNPLDFKDEDMKNARKFLVKALLSTEENVLHDIAKRDERVRQDVKDTTDLISSLKEHDLFDDAMDSLSIDDSGIVMGSVMPAITEPPSTTIDGNILPIYNYSFENSSEAVKKIVNESILIKKAYLDSKTLFYQEYKPIYEKARTTTGTLLDKQAYDDLLAVNNSSTKSMKDRKKKYTIGSVSLCPNMLLRDDKRVPTLESVFDIIMEYHHDRAHGRDAKMIKSYMDKDWYKIPREAVVLFVNHCPICKQKQKIIPTAEQRPLRMIITHEIGERGQMDLIDFTRITRHGMQYVLRMVDCLSGFSFIRVMPNRTSETVATAICEIFSTAIIPRIMQSDNGPEFLKECLQVMNENFPYVKTVKGRAHHPQTQGCVERGNGTFKKALEKVIASKKDGDWTRDAYAANAMINKREHHGRGMISPYDAYYGMKPSGNRMNFINDEVQNIINNEYGYIALQHLIAKANVNETFAVADQSSLISLMNEMDIYHESLSDQQMIGFDVNEHISEIVDSFLTSIRTGDQSSWMNWLTVYREATPSDIDVLINSRNNQERSSLQIASLVGTEGIESREGTREMNRKRCHDGQIKQAQKVNAKRTLGYNVSLKEGTIVSIAIERMSNNPLYGVIESYESKTRHDEEVRTYRVRTNMGVIEESLGRDQLTEVPGTTTSIMGIPEISDDLEILPLKQIVQKMVSESPTHKSFRKKI